MASGDRDSFALAMTEAARRAVRDAPIPSFFSATVSTPGPPGIDSPVGIIRDGETVETQALVVGGFLPDIGERVYGVNVPPHGAVIFGRVGSIGSNVIGEVWQGYNGATPTDSLVAAAFTTWPLLLATAVPVPAVAVRMIAEVQLTGLEQTAASGRFELQQVTGAGAGAIHRASSATGGARFGVVLSEQYNVSAFAGGPISCRVDGRRIAGAGSLDYDVGSRGRWLFRFFDS